MEKRRRTKVSDMSVAWCSPDEAAGAQERRQREAKEITNETAESFVGSQEYVRSESSTSGAWACRLTLGCRRILSEKLHSEDTNVQLHCNPTHRYNMGPLMNSRSERKLDLFS